MNLQSFRQNKALIIAMSLVIGLVVVMVYRTDATLNDTTDGQLLQDTTNDTPTESQVINEESIHEIKDALANMQEKFAAQSSEIEKLSQRNLRDISELSKLQDESGSRGITDISNSNSEEIYEIDPDYQQEQEAIEAEARQAAYMNGIEDFFTSQDENISWTTQVESDFQSALENYASLVELSNVSCRDVMCKISASIIAGNDESGAQLPPLDHIIHGDLEWQGQSLYEMDLDTGEITLYLMRNGVDLPQENF